MGFKFEAKWLEEEACEGIVENAWKTSSDIHGREVSETLREVAKDLIDWSKNVLGDLEKRIARTKKELERWRRAPISTEQVNKEHMLRYKLEKLEQQRDTYWRQRAHVGWLQKGDRNTKFYHAYASERKRRNRIKKLKVEGGEWWMERRRWRRW